MQSSDSSLPGRAATGTRATPLKARLAAALCAMSLGGAMVFMVGFSHIGVVHNAAHDTRHSFAFPCH